MNYQAPEPNWLDPAQSANTHYGQWLTSSNIWLNGLGTDGSGSNCLGGALDGSCRELITGIPFVKQAVCTEINKKLGWGTDSNGTPFQDSGLSFGASTHTGFTGSYSNGNNMGVAAPSHYTNIMAGCVEGLTDPTTGAYSFFQVLVVR